LIEQKKIDQHNIDSTEQSSQPLPQLEIPKSKRGLIPKKQWPSDSTGSGIQIKNYHSLAMQALSIFYKEPQSYKEAIASPHTEQWRNGMNKEIASLKETTPGRWCLLPTTAKSFQIEGNSKRKETR
jgi:hypothetical protein